MSFFIDPQDEDAIVYSGHAEGIADSELEGISDMRNMNIISVPGEASVNFATSQISPPTISTGTVTSADSGTEYLTYTGASGLENYMTIVFSATTVGGVSTNTAYWIKNLNGAGAGTFQITSDYAQISTVNISGTGTGTFSVVRVGLEPFTGATGTPKFFTYDSTDAKYFMLETTGNMWSNLYTTTSGYWTYTGPSGTAQTNQGCGLAYYQAFNGASNDNRFIFVFRNQTIDYFQPSLGTWHFGWRPSTGATSYANATLNTSTTFHNAYVGTDNVLYWCDGNFIGSVFEKPDGPPQSISFDPTNTATYTYATSGQALKLPYLDQAQCLAELGTNLLIGGRNNAIYPWNRTATSFTYPILISEYNIQQLVTVNTQTYIFVGNRGRIYITNGTNAQFYKKLPDHLSGTVEPYYTWGGAMSNKNQLYFSASVTNNASVAITTMGGVWAIDLDNKAIRMTNQLSYGTYAGYALCLIPNFSSTAAGSGFFAGWNSGASTNGIDTTVSTPYTGSQAYIDYDLTPVGTFLRKKTYKTVEYKLSVPMVTSESVSIYYRSNFNDSYTLIFTSNGTSGSGSISDNNSVNFENVQWVQLRAVTNSTASSPSYTRLTEIRIK